MNNLKNYLLQSGDELIVPKSAWNLIQHHAVYLGRGFDETDWVIENNTQGGVRLISLIDFLKECGKVNKIIPFNGTNEQRRALVQKALLSVGKPYDLINFNCEHFTTELKTGIALSKQVNMVKNILAFFLFLAAIKYLSDTKL